MTESPESIIEFWFGEAAPDTVVAKRQTSLWFKKQASTAFAFDHLARAHCEAGLECHDDAALPAVYRVFFYLPLEHAEDPAMQARSVALFRELAADVGKEAETVFNGFVDYAQRHALVIERFGRFPHRNAILGRESTAQELEFLTQPGSSF